MEVDTRYIDNMSVLLTPAFILLKNKIISFNLGDDDIAELMEIGSNNIKAQLSNFNGNNVINAFWTTIQVLFDKFDIKQDTHVKIVDSKIDGFEGKKMLAVKTDVLIEQYRKYCGNNAKSAQEIRDGLQQIKSFIKVKPVKFKMAQTGSNEYKSTTYNQAYVFDYDLLTADYNVDFGY